MWVIGGNGRAFGILSQASLLSRQVDRRNGFRAYNADALKARRDKCGTAWSGRVGTNRHHPARIRRRLVAPLTCSACPFLSATTILCFENGIYVFHRVECTMEYLRNVRRSVPVSQSPEKWVASRPLYSWIPASSMKWTDEQSFRMQRLRKEVFRRRATVVCVHEDYAAVSFDTTHG
jgi:hypothetical protein